MRRKNNDHKTIYKLFYVCCDDIQDIELSTALRSLLKILCEGIRDRAITITNEIKHNLSTGLCTSPHLSRLYTLILCGNLEEFIFGVCKKRGILLRFTSFLSILNDKICKNMVKYTE